MKTDIEIVGEGLESFAKELGLISRSVVKRARKDLKLKDVRIVFRVSQDLASLKEINGIGSYCPSSSLIKISLDPNHKEVKKNLARVLEQALFHELHHAARWGAGEMGETLFGHLMNEGLADHYALKQTGLKSPWLKQISKKELDRFISRAEKEYRNEKFSYEDWFSSGSKKRRLPRFIGYSIGFELVKRQ